MTREQVLQIAGAAQCDPRTVEAYYKGKNVRPLLKDRIDAAAKKLKIKNGGHA